MARSKGSPLAGAFDTTVRVSAVLFVLEVADGLFALGLDRFGREIEGVNLDQDTLDFDGGRMPPVEILRGCWTRRCATVKSCAPRG